MTTYYELLGVEPDADDAVVKAAFRKALKEHHPDLNSGDANAEQRSRKLIQAYNVLKNPKRRDRYNRALLRGRSQHRPMLPIVALASVGIVVMGGLLFRNLSQTAKHKSPSHEVQISKLAPPAVSTAGPAPDTPEASEPASTPQPVAHLVAWQAIEKTGTMAELWVYAQTYPNTLEGTLAELRLWRLIDTSEEVASLEALAEDSFGRVAERVRRRLETLTSGAPAAGNLPPQPREEAASATNPASPLSETAPQPASSGLGQPTSESAPVLPR